LVVFGTALELFSEAQLTPVRIDYYLLLCK
jgi:hypothetical protein